MSQLNVRVRNPLHISLGLLIGFCLLYMIGFPKAGIRIYNIPVTIGYALSPFLLIVALLAALGARKIPADRVLCLLGGVVMAVWAWSMMSVNGIQETGLAISLFTSFLYLPLFGMVAMSGLIMESHGNTVEGALKLALRIVALYGIFLFVYKLTTGSWIEIPYLTVNVDDIGNVGEMNNNRGGIFKLISTYNNGNIYGVSMCIMAMLYIRIEKHKSFLIAFFVAMVLTLSRTVWIGIGLIGFTYAFSQGLGLKRILYGILLGVLGIAAIASAMAMMGRDLSFILDSRLGGRINSVELLRNVSFASGEPFHGIAEMTYVSMSIYFGYFGLILFLFYIFSPIILLRLEGVPYFSQSKAAACFQGLVIYSVVAMSDGAFSNIPVMMIYWMIAGLGFWYRRTGQ